jgi:hypothetical protein
MYSEELEKEILNESFKMREVIPKTLDDLLKAAENPSQLTKEVWQVQTQFDKELVSCLRNTLTKSFDFFQD